ncbi:MAG: ABC transporter permease [Propionibacteriaceae bacterium]|jgi:peptide/nickel transport system permease protein|nr:ABC transporter permease [Propionibacteriaceae bacterium]
MSDVLSMMPAAATPKIAGPGRRSHSRMRLYARRFRRNKPAVVGVAIFVLLVLVAVIGPRIARYSISEIDFLALAQPPGGTHWFGTNQTGLDLYAMTVHGLGRSMIIAVAVSLLTLLIASFLGALAAYMGGWVEKIILGVINFILVMPLFLLEALVAQKTGGNWLWLIVVLTAFGWMVMARVIWQLSTSIREREYIAAARYMGVRGVVVVFRHMIPNIGSLLVVQFTLGIVSTVMSETALSFLGFGIKIPDVSLGSMLIDGQSVLTTTPWAFFFPAGTMTLLTISVALMADGLRDALDPNSAAGGRA